jgi:hypothetical protein
LLLKRDINAIPPRRMMERREAEFDEFEQKLSELPGNTTIPFHVDAQISAERPLLPSHQHDSKEHAASYPWNFPAGLDPEWVAFEVYNEVEDSDSETEPESPPSSRHFLRAQSAHLDGGEKLPMSPPEHQITMSLSHAQRQRSTMSNPLFNSIRTSLSLLETLLRLTSLQIFQQQSHLSISDELLNFFLEESSTTGAGGDEQHRQRIRAEARRKVGWDPYDESPLKRRGEDYQYRDKRYEDSGNTPDGWVSGAENSPILTSKMSTDDVDQSPRREYTTSPNSSRHVRRHESPPALSQSLNTRFLISPDSPSSPSCSELAAS